MRTGWLATLPDDQVDVIPLSDGGPGFVDCVVAATGAQRLSAEVHDLLGRNVTASYARKDDTVWIESAQVIGLHLVEAKQRDPRLTSTYGVGELIAKAISEGAAHIIIGVGGTATNDAGAGAMAALGATGIGGNLSQGGAALGRLESVDIATSIAMTRNIRLTVATDVDNPLLGERGATKTFARQKGASDQMIAELEVSLSHFVHLVGKRGDGKDAAVALGAGAGGGLGYALIHLGGTRISGADYLASLLSVEARIENCDLVITGEGCVDDQTLHGKLPLHVAARAMHYAKPCVVIGGEVRLGKRELAKNGFDAGYALANQVGIERAIAEPEAALIEVMQRVARSWGRIK